VPATQVSDAGHTFPQEPQLLLSLFSSTQAVPHRVCPAPHAGTQAPALHVVPVAQTWPHEPQLLLSVWVLMQLVPQKLVPGPHTPAQVPLTQAVPGAHTTPQAPQLSLSVPVFVQAQPQKVDPGPHTLTHWPPLHAEPAPQTWPHEPQLLLSLAKLVQVDGAAPPKQQLEELPVQTASLWFATCEATAEAPTVMTCTFPGLPGGKWQIVTLGSEAACTWSAVRTLPSAVPTSTVRSTLTRDHIFIQQLLRSWSATWRAATDPVDEPSG